MSAVKYTKAGTHAYTLREVKGGTISKGVTYSDAEYTIETTITDNGDGTLSATHVLKDDVKAATFENAYSVTPLDAEFDFWPGQGHRRSRLDGLRQVQLYHYRFRGHPAARSRNRNRE